MTEMKDTNRRAEKQIDRLFMLCRALQGAEQALGARLRRILLQ